MQLAKSLGASVTAVCRGEHVPLVASLGADHVIDYTTEDFTTLGANYDVVFDAVGKTSFARCKPLLRPNGVFLATDFGPFPWNPLLALTTRVVGSRKVLFPLPKDNQEIVRYLRERLQSGEFRPVIDRTYPLDDIAEAYRYVDTEQKVGNVVITVPDRRSSTRLTRGHEPRAAGRTSVPNVPLSPAGERKGLVVRGSVLETCHRRSVPPPQPDQKREGPH